MVESSIRLEISLQALKTMEALKMSLSIWESHLPLKGLIEKKPYKHNFHKAFINTCEPPATGFELETVVNG